MKCIQCGTDNNLKDRTANQGRCKNCNHPFAFEPTSMGITKITDSFFAKAIADISTNNTLFFTPKQLFYLIEKRTKDYKQGPVCDLFIYIVSLCIGGFIGGLVLSGIIGIIWGGNSFNSELLFIITFVINIFWIKGINSQSQAVNLNLVGRQKCLRSLRFIGIFNLICGIPLSLLSESFFNFATIVIIGMIEIYLGNRKIDTGDTHYYQFFRLEKNQFQIWLERWQQINGNISKMLPSPREETTPVVVNPEVSAYSFDRLVVCDRASIAQLLIANHFHFENNCAILSITGYPQNIFATTMEMLRRNPDLKVYAIHDCSPLGLGLVNRLRSSENWFLNTNIPIVDIGILPRQVMGIERDIFIQKSEECARDAQQLPTDIRRELSTEELAWLDSGKFVELESFTPQKLIQILHGGIAQSQDLGSDNSSMIIVGDTYGSGSAIYVAESFG